MYFTVVLALYFGACVDGVISGGKQSLTEEDLESELFQGFVREAELECNKAVNSESWFVLEGPVDGTKQVVSGIKYEFSFLQEESNCKKEEKLAQANQTSCEPKENGSRSAARSQTGVFGPLATKSQFRDFLELRKLRQMCSVGVLYAPHAGPPVIKVKVVDVSQADADQEADEEALESMEPMTPVTGLKLNAQLLLELMFNTDQHGRKQQLESHIVRLIMSVASAAKNEKCKKALTTTENEQTVDTVKWLKLWNPHAM
ncbi:hypothetical protein CLF_110386 [Clonorchis sinensis]|uniref:Cystatin domain-containing protein n=1 Tax=Clonorchis sinensis TaxID=79923 RepID=G7YKM2_CLOSI|nr:hypothetical protein CLF_110386 [Clonorchis sinensis]